MGIRKHKPTTPGRRGSSVADFAEVTKSTPEKALLLERLEYGNFYGSIREIHVGGKVVANGAAAYGPERLRPGTYSASPILAGGRIYITSEDGVTSVFAAGPKFELLAENAVDEYTLSSVAISNGQIFLRTDKHLYAIGSVRAD